eukprot:TRINITY_DN11926_c0_g1_i1.p1 TRINITY_DN11926_c0_g1~~TRINITY_DN11926_c0_g1_i1.p1  ORF type:complete len:267 (-),score=57.11 TRINITY_DN11926_c0_g1_i1:119-919(-)
MVADKWKQLKAARNFECVRVQADKKKQFELRQNQIDELLKWASGKKVDSEWLHIEDDVPVHFVSQNGDENPLRFSEDAFVEPPQKGKQKAGSNETKAPANKKAKTDTKAPQQSPAKSAKIPSDFWKPESKPKFTPMALKKTEEKLGYTLPRSYLQLMMKQNGGTPTRGKITNGGFAATVESFFAIEDLVEEAENWLEEWEYPDIGIYICDCPSGGHDMICLEYSKCGKKGEPRVCHVDQEGDFEVTELAPTFADFIENLEEGGEDY